MREDLNWLATAAIESREGLRRIFKRPGGAVGQGSKNMTQTISARFHIAKYNANNRMP